MSAHFLKNWGGGALFPDLPQCIINRLYIVFNNLLGMSFCD